LFRLTHHNITWIRNLCTNIERAVLNVQSSNTYPFKESVEEFLVLNIL